MLAATSVLPMTIDPSAGSAQLRGKQRHLRRCETSRESAQNSVNCRATEVDDAAYLTDSRALFGEQLDCPFLFLGQTDTPTGFATTPSFSGGRAAAWPARILSTRISVSNCATLARTCAMSRPAGVEGQGRSLRLTRLISRLSSSKQSRQTSCCPAQSIHTPTDNGGHSPAVDCRLQPIPTRSAHCLARELILVPSDGLVLCGGPPLKIGKLSSNILLPVPFRHTAVNGNVFHGEVGSLAPG